ncbi:integral membrane sensor signal transduction histidine kinase [Syntrophobotulus glycolicus DSM 8271]|uniref:histidine kinase n=1 Tax=Syntrophobotulus glycolicus (strain DSM 8271 / FlGlyR) TaxID=645991 RepID=F0T2W0_SYNGF|nr:sensor histidine kinase [Syntrophobotulus glycolicus]ADY57597.1 integral membrane sensor signal transduction histidine kinase [Syntrophobotulus glycolicus DSM 8271]
MKHLMKILFLIYIIFLFISSDNVSYTEVLLIVLFSGVNVFKERFSDTLHWIIISFILVCIGIWFDRSFMVLLCISIFDLVYRKVWILVLPVFILGLLLAIEFNTPLVSLLMAVSAALAFVLKEAEQSQSEYLSRLDEERRLRYDLEKAKNKLLQVSKEVAHLTEVRERNRIARDIHDHVGHSIAGILFQLQAADRILAKDRKKAEEIIKKSIESLAEALSLLRNTVYNIKPDKTLGIAYLKSIIDNFGFCPAQFKVLGDAGSLAPPHMEILSSIFKEALTNAAKYSRATQMEIFLEINEKFSRLYIKDNGIGCKKIKEGLGISGMKERVADMGGTISISSDEGFLIVCFLPVGNHEGNGV